MQLNDALDIFLNSFIGRNDPELRDSLSTITFVSEKHKKDILFLEGEEGDTIYYLISGIVKLSRTNPEGKEAVVHFVHSGEMFAEILFYTESRYPVTATVLDNAVLLGISAGKMARLLETSPGFSMRLIGLLARRLQYFVTMIEELVTSDVRQRFIAYLVHLSEDRNNTRFRLPVPKGELAALLGTTPETFSRLLHQLDSEGVVKIHGREITLLKVPSQET
ncbi:MAG: Crp/Fnr family transcriptional regulator [Acidobacteria bacterium CG_4_9_14_3_um_filter_49_7]|nr:MAG: Crp/Fnr family transcriptional regulator [Acidobacteria bacterium CG_4_9_14_3_um_filter_49_7]